MHQVAEILHRDATLLSQLMLAQNGLTESLSGLGQIQTAVQAGVVPTADAFQLLSNGLLGCRGALALQRFVILFLVCLLVL